MKSTQKSYHLIDEFVDCSQFGCTFSTVQMPWDMRKLKICNLEKYSAVNSNFFSSDECDVT